jgi:uridine monophosphate synthetase
VTKGFFDQLDARVAATGSLLCVGLDPRRATPIKALARCRAIIDATASRVAAFKPNSAFFEAMGPEGIEVLIEVVESIPDEIPVLLDAKRGDIASTAEAYAVAAFDTIGAGAVTVNPYLGADAFDPFLQHEGRGIFVLCRTSNPSGAAFQEMELSSGDPLYMAVARAVAALPMDRAGLVVGATEPEAMARVRSAVPKHWILAPGVGAQGGSLESTVAAGIRIDGSGLLLPVSRAIADAPNPESVVTELNLAVNRARDRAGTVAPAAEPSLAVGLFDAGCIRFGDFELKSGARSPIYLDLRTLTGHPNLLRRVAAQYLPLLGAPIRIAGVPLAGLPIATAVSLVSAIPLVYPRPEQKDHGTRSTIEGPFEAGDRVVVIDDVATSGSSVLEAVDQLRGAGLMVDRAVVLIDRESGAGRALAEQGIRLHSVMKLSDVIGLLLEAGRISEDEARRVREFLVA